MAHPFLLTWYLIGVLAVCATVIHAVSTKRYVPSGQTALAVIYLVFFGTIIQDTGILTASGLTDFLLFSVALYAIDFFLKKYVRDETAGEE